MFHRSFINRPRFEFGLKPLRVISTHSEPQPQRERDEFAFLSVVQCYGEVIFITRLVLDGGDCKIIDLMVCLQGMCSKELPLTKYLNGYYLTYLLVRTEY